MANDMKQILCLGWWLFEKEFQIQAKHKIRITLCDVRYRTRYTI